MTGKESPAAEKLTTIALVKMNNSGALLEAYNKQACNVTRTSNKILLPDPHFLSAKYTTNGRYVGPLLK